MTKKNDLKARLGALEAAIVTGSAQDGAVTMARKSVDLCSDVFAGGVRPCPDL